MMTQQTGYKLGAPERGQRRPSLSISPTTGGSPPDLAARQERRLSVSRLTDPTLASSQRATSTSRPDSRASGAINNRPSSRATNVVSRAQSRASSVTTIGGKKYKVSDCYAILYDIDQGPYQLISSHEILRRGRVDSSIVARAVEPTGVQNLLGNEMLSKLDQMVSTQHGKICLVLGPDPSLTSSFLNGSNHHKGYLAFTITHLLSVKRLDPHNLHILLSAVQIKDKEAAYDLVTQDPLTFKTTSAQSEKNYTLSNWTETLVEDNKTVQDTLHIVEQKSQMSTGIVVIRLQILAGTLAAHKRDSRGQKTRNTKHTGKTYVHWVVNAPESTGLVMSNLSTALYGFSDALQRTNPKPSGYLSSAVAKLLHLDLLQRAELFTVVNIPPSSERLVGSASSLKLACTLNLPGRTEITGKVSQTLLQEPQSVAPTAPVGSQTLPSTHASGGLAGSTRPTFNIFRDGPTSWTASTPVGSAHEARRPPSVSAPHVFDRSIITSPPVAAPSEHSSRANSTTSALIHLPVFSTGTPTPTPSGGRRSSENPRDAVITSMQRQVDSLSAMCQARFNHIDQKLEGIPALRDTVHRLESVVLDGLAQGFAPVHPGDFTFTTVTSDQSMESEVRFNGNPE